MFVITNVPGANALTVAEVEKNMSVKERHVYLIGVVEGLAEARWRKDSPDQTGMDCIFDWYLSEPKVRAKELDAWFKRYPDKPVETLLYLLIKKECGE